MKKYNFLTLMLLIGSLSMVACSDNNNPSDDPSDDPIIVDPTGPDACLSLTMKQLPTKMQYYLGEKFDPTGMILSAKMRQNNEINTIDVSYPNDELAFYNDTCSTIGKHTLTIEYSNNTLTLQVLVVEKSSSYSVELGNMDKANDNRGTWFYEAINSTEVSSLTVDSNKLSGKINSGNDGITLNYAINDSDLSGGFDGIEYYNMAFSININASGKILYGEKEYAINGNENTEIKLPAAYSKQKSFSFKLVPNSIPSGGFSFSTDKIKLTNNLLTKGQNADVCGDPGVWYSFSATSDVLPYLPQTDGENLFTEIESFSSSSSGVYFRYQPTFALGSTFRMSCDVTCLSENGVKVQFGINTANGGTSSKTIGANETYSFSKGGFTVNTSQPFAIAIKNNTDSPTNAERMPIKIMVSNISFVQE